MPPFFASILLGREGKRKVVWIRWGGGLERDDLRGVNGGTKGGARGHRGSIGWMWRVG